jgi:uncharacterized membrane protein
MVKIQSALRTYFTEVCILFLTPFIFLYGVRERGLWSDELFTAYNIGRGLISGNWLDYRAANVLQLLPSDSFLTAKAADATPPLFDFIALAWMYLFGTSDIAIRSLSVCIAIILLVVLSRAFSSLPSKILRFLFLFLLAISPSFLTYSHEARSYMLTALTCILWFLYGLMPLRERLLKPEGARDLVKFWFLSSIFFYSNYSNLVLYGIFFLLILSVNIRSSLNMCKHFFPPLFTLIPWLVLNFPSIQFQNSGGIAWKIYNSNDIWPSVKSIFVFMLPTQLSKINLIIFLGVLTLLFKNALHPATPRFDKPIFPSRLLVLGVIFHTAWSFTLMFGPGQWHPRYLISDFALLAILFGTKLGSLKGADEKIVVVLLTGLIVSNLVSLQNSSLNPTEDYKLASKEIAKEYNSKTLILTTWKPNYGYYEWYLRKYIPGKINHESISNESDVIQFCKDATLTKEYDQIILFRHSSHGDMEDKLSKSCTGVLESKKQIPYHGVSVTTYVSIF